MMNIFISKTNSKYLLFFLGDDIDGHKRKHRQKTLETIETQISKKWNTMECKWLKTKTQTWNERKHDENRYRMEIITQWKGLHLVWMCFHSLTSDSLSSFSCIRFRLVSAFLCWLYFLHYVSILEHTNQNWNRHRIDTHTTQISITHCIKHAI